MTKSKLAALAVEVVLDASLGLLCLLVLALAI